jgi:putative flippase GtrA
MTGVLRQSLHFGAVGLVNTAVGLAVIYAVMFFFRTGPAIANAVGYAVGLAISFALNRSWTFDSKGGLAHLLPKFLVVIAAAYLLNLSAVMAAISLFSVAPYLAQAMGVSLYTVCSFFGCRWFVFAQPQPA